MKKHYDIVIVGGGMVGATLACALAAQPATAHLTVLLVDAQPPALSKEERVSFDSRSTALSAASRLILERFGLWSSIAAGACPIEKIQVSDHGRFGTTTLARDEFDVPALGYVVENSVFSAALNAELARLPSCTVLAPAKITAAVPSVGGMRVTVAAVSESSAASAQPKELTAKLVVVAEGGRSSLCEQLGIVRSQHDYGQHALITNVGLGQAHAGVAYERFTRTGPLAMLPLLPVDGEQRASLVWTLAADEAQAYASLSDTELLARLQRQFGWRLGRLQRLGERVIYPLSLRVAQEQVRPNVVLLGNVAHTLHPVAGQGMNLSLRDIDALVLTLGESERERTAAEEETETETKHPELALGSMCTLNKYLHKREDDQALMIGVTDGLTKLFSSDDKARVLLRKAGLLSIDLIPALKKTFGARAMGFD